MATHLSRYFISCGMKCRGVYSPTYVHAGNLAEQLDADTFESVEQLWSRVREEIIPIVLIAVKDDALKSVGGTLPRGLDRTLVLHTSGSTPMAVLSRAAHYGVLYPLQTFSHHRQVDIKEVHFYVESSDADAERILQELVSELSLHYVTPCTSEQRGYVHLSAVFACNFVNHMYARGEAILERAGLDPSALNPLMQETLSKALEFPPATVQTGPAVRGDRTTMDRHLDLLKDYPTDADLYRRISQAIYENAHSKELKDEQNQ